MRKICLAMWLLAAFGVVSCRPADTIVPHTSTPSTHSVSPLPTPITPQVTPAATRAAPISPVSTPIAASGIHLTATIGPTCPGPERPGQVCTQPYQGLFVVTRAGDGAEVARATTDQNGQATFDLPPGVYTITPQIESKFPMGAPTSATVVDGQYVAVTVELDSGMR